MQQNPNEIKERIMRILRLKGPNIPVRISKEIGISILLTSAFLSELLSEKKIKTSSLRVGSSPVYFIPGQENQLEKYSDSLKSKEKEAYLLLKEKKILEDKNQNPAIRVALRAIKDFAIPFKKDKEIYWRYLTTKEEEIIAKFKPTSITIESSPQKKEDKKLDIFDKENKRQGQKTKKEIQESSKKQKKKIVRKKTTTKKDEKFFNKVKEFLSNNSIEILDIEGFNKFSVTLKVRKDSKELLLIAYNKKRITEKEFIDANKKSKEKNLKYILLSLGEPTKKLSNLIESIKNLNLIQKIE